MAKLIASEQVVHKCASELKRQGVEPTVLGVQAATGGSFTTVARHLETWQAKQAELIEQSLAVPEDVREKGVEFAASVWRAMAQEAVTIINAARQAANERVDQAVKARAEAMQAVAQLEEAEASLSAELSSLRERCRNLEVELAIARDRQQA